jgi:hypothetical protein
MLFSLRRMVFSSALQMCYSNDGPHFDLIEPEIVKINNIAVYPLPPADVIVGENMEMKAVLGIRIRNLHRRIRIQLWLCIFTKYLFPERCS